MVLVLHSLGLDGLLEVYELLHSALVCTEPLLEELAGITSLIKLEKIDCTALVWGETSNLVDDLTDEFHSLSLVSTDSLWHQCKKAPTTTEVTIKPRRFIKSESKPLVKLSYYVLPCELEVEWFIYSWLMVI